MTTVYQGCERRIDTLVDPDNRAPVDLALRHRELRAIGERSIGDVVGELSLAKLHTIRRVVGLRRRDPELFTGDYRPLWAHGPHAHRVFAFARGDDLVVVVPRLGAGADGWRGTTLELPAGVWINVLSDTTHAGGSHARAPALVSDDRK